MTLHELLALFTSKNIEYTTAHLDAVDQNAQLTDVASDSREVTPGSLFVCKGAHFWRLGLLRTSASSRSRRSCRQ